MILDIVFYIYILIILVMFFCIASSDLFNLLILSELFWISLYTLALLVALTLNNVEIASLSLFFLMFSAVEISAGVSIILLKKQKRETLELKSFSYLKLNIFKQNRSLF